MTPILNAPVRYWQCPTCEAVDTTRQHGHHSRMHPCAQLGIIVPMVELDGPDDTVAAHRTRHVVVEREDWIGSEVGVRRELVNQMPVSGVRLERPDGSNDAVVFPGTATFNTNRRS